MAVSVVGHWASFPSHLTSSYSHECLSFWRSFLLFLAPRSSYLKRWLNACRLAPSVQPPPATLSHTKWILLLRGAMVSAGFTAARNRCYTGRSSDSPQRTKLHEVGRHDGLVILVEPQQRQPRRAGRDTPTMETAPPRRSLRAAMIASACWRRFPRDFRSVDRCEERRQR